MSVGEANAALSEAGIDSPYSNRTYRALKVVSTDPRAGESVGRYEKVDFQLTRVSVTKVVDGDTLRLSTGDQVRLIGLDAPELGTCGGAKATRFLRDMVAGTDVDVDTTAKRKNRDKYGRLLAYVGTPTVNDVGYQLLIKGLAVPRYNSRDGYGAHPAEKIYAKGAARSKRFSCKPKRPPRPFVQPDPRRWVCSYSPTFDRDWHNDALCTNGSEFERPYLRGWDSYVTPPEIMESAREYERVLNGG